MLKEANTTSYFPVSLKIFFFLSFTYFYFILITNILIDSSDEIYKEIKKNNRLSLNSTEKVKYLTDFCNLDAILLRAKFLECTDDSLNSKCLYALLSVFRDTYPNSPISDFCHRYLTTQPLVPVKWISELRNELERLELLDPSHKLAIFLRVYSLFYFLFFSNFSILNSLDGASRKVGRDYDRFFQFFRQHCLSNKPRKAVKLHLCSSGLFKSSLVNPVSLDSFQVLNIDAPSSLPKSNLTLNLKAVPTGMSILSMYLFICQKSSFNSSLLTVKIIKKNNLRSIIKWLRRI